MSGAVREMKGDTRRGADVLNGLWIIFSEDIERHDVDGSEQRQRQCGKTSTCNLKMSALFDPRINRRLIAPVR